MGQNKKMKIIISLLLLFLPSCTIHYTSLDNQIVKTKNGKYYRVVYVTGDLYYFVKLKMFVTTKKDTIFMEE
jgi:hypothetical protein